MDYKDKTKEELIQELLDLQQEFLSYKKINKNNLTNNVDNLIWNQSLLKLMANSSPLGFLVVDNRNDEILYFNNRFCEIWGIAHLAEKMKNGQMKNNDTIPYFLPLLANIQEFEEYYKSLQDENNRIVIKDEIPFKNNRTIQRFSTQIRGENDEYFGRFYIFEDITEKNNLVKDLAKERNRLNDIIKGTNVGTWEWNIQTGETIISERWAEIIGYTKAEILPINVEIWSKFVHPDDTIVSGELLEKHFKGELEYYTFEARMKHKNGNWVWVLETGKVNTWSKDGKPLLMSGFNLDITEHKHIIDELIKSQQTYRALNEAAFDAIFFSENGICIEQNEAARKIFGYTDEEAIGKLITEWIVQDERSLVMQNILDGIQDPYEVTALKKDGSTFPCMLSGKMVNFKGRSVRVSSLRDITSQKQAEEKFSKAFQSNSIVMVISNLATGEIIDVNEKTLEILSLKREEVVGKTAVELGLFANLNERIGLFEEILQKNENEFFQKEVIYNSKNGPLTFLIAVKKIMISNEFCVLVSMVDITERKKTEAELFESEVKLRTIIETSPDGVIISSLDGITQFITHKSSLMFGFENSADVLGRNIFEFIHPNYHEKAKHFINELLLGKITGNNDYLLLKKDGSTFYGEANANIIYDKNNNPTSILFVIRDITDRKETEKELADSTFRMKLATKSGGVGIWDYEIEKDTLVWDEQMYLLYGIKKEDFKIENSLWKVFVHPDDLELANTQTQIKILEANDLNIVYRIIWPNGDVKYINSKAVIQYDDDSKPIHILGTNRDITEQILAEAETNKARKEAEDANHAKSEFLSGMSHELRTPLNSILGFAQLMEMGELSTKQKNGIEHILSSGKHLLGLINEVLELSKIEAGYVNSKKENVNIFESIYVVVDALKPSILNRKINVEIKLPEGPPIIIKSDNKLITQILFNLLNNAIKYNKLEGKIKIKTEIIGSISNGNSKLKISITDTGIGISAPNLQKLFNPFERIGAEASGIEGTGLGLSVVKKLMTVLEGNVGVESEVEVGSTFWIELPLQSKDDFQLEKIDSQNEQILGLQSDIRVHEKDKADRADELKVFKNELDKNKIEKDLINKKGIVLCIEDNKRNIELIKQVISLKRPNIEIISSLTGKETLQLAIINKPDLILLDLNLPDIIGSEIIRSLQLNKKTKNIPIIVMSADVNPQKIEKALSLGAKKYLTKPIELEVLIGLIDKWMGIENN